MTIKTSKPAIAAVLRVMQEHNLSTIEIMGIMVEIDKMKTEEKRNEKRKRVSGEKVKDT